MKTPGLDFNNWLKSKFVIPAIVLAFISGISVLNEIINLTGFSINEYLKTEKVINILFFCNFIFAIYVIVLGGRKYRVLSNKKLNEFEFKYLNRLVISKDYIDENFSKKDKIKLWKKYKKGVNKTMDQFIWFWIISWSFFAINYGLRLLEELKYLNEIPEKFYNALNNLGSLMFIFLFMTLSISTSGKKIFTWFLYCVFVFGISLLQMEDKSIPFSMASGIFGALAFSSFVGALDSKFANIPLWIIIALFFYASIQPLFFVLNNENIKLEYISLVLSLALVLKVILFIAVSWLINTDRLLFTILEEGSLNFGRNVNFKTFKNLKITNEKKMQ